MESLSRRIDAITFDIQLLEGDHRVAAASAVDGDAAALRKVEKIETQITAKQKELTRLRAALEHASSQVGEAEIDEEKREQRRRGLALVEAHGNFFKAIDDADAAIDDLAAALSRAALAAGEMGETVGISKVQGYFHGRITGALRVELAHRLPQFFERMLHDDHAGYLGGHFENHPHWLASTCVLQRHHAQYLKACLVAADVHPDAYFLATGELTVDEDAPNEAGPAGIDPVLEATEVASDPSETRSNGEPVAEATREGETK